MPSGGPAGRWRLDPRTKLLALVVVNAMAFQIVSQTALAAAFLLVCGLLAGCWPLGRWLRFAVGVPLVVIASVLAAAHIDQPLVAIAAMAGYWSGRFAISIGMAGYVLASVRPAEFTAALQAMRIPRSLVVPMTVMLRFIPTAFGELRAIVEAMRLRGLLTGSWSALRHPIRTAEFVVVPLLASSTRIGDDLAASGLLRGLTRPGRRTCITRLVFGWPDALLIGLLGGLIALLVTGWELL